MRSTSKSNSGHIRKRVSFGAVFFSLILAVLVIGSAALASGITAPPHGPLAQATSTVPQAVGTSQVPGAVETGGVPPPIITGELPDAQLTADAGISNSQGNNNNSVPGTTSPAGSSSFPWLAVVLLVVVVLLLLGAFAIMRTRRTSMVATGAATMPLPPAPPVSTTSTALPPTTATTTTTTSTSPNVAAPVAPAVAAAPVVAESQTTTTTTPLPKTITCPNCSTVNEWSENFCHECGQDLRPVRAGIIAAAAPPQDIVTEDMPYLETLDRKDEQLEYVLSRKRVVVGTAAGNDIVIDSSFNGYETVSPRHAELRREGDGFVLVDLNSENGTFVNDARTGENLLSAGDQIKFGSVKFMYRVP